MERWRNVPGLIGYAVKSNGMVRSPSGAITSSKMIHRVVSGRRVKLWTPELVCKAFKRNPYRTGFVRFLNDDMDDVRASNLVWEPLTRRRYTDLNGETWVTLWCCPQYQVSDRGRIRRAQPAQRTRVGKVLRQQKDRDGYLRCNVWNDALEKCVRVNVARAMLVSFSGKNPVLLDAAHEDGVRSHNFLENVNWKTRTENQADRRRHGTHLRGDAHPNAVTNEKQVRRIRKLRNRGHTLAELSSTFGLSRWAIGSILRGTNWSHVT